MNAVSAEEKAALLAPAAHEQRFFVTIKRDGQSVRREVWAADWFSAWLDAFDAHGMAAKIEVARA